MKDTIPGLVHSSFSHQSTRRTTQVEALKLFLFGV